jgi:fatty acid synthase
MGQRVMGVITSGALSSVVLADKNLMWNVPQHWTLEDAATVCCVYGTVSYHKLNQN